MASVFPLSPVIRSPGKWPQRSAGWGKAPTCVPFQLLVISHLRQQITEPIPQALACLASWLQLEPDVPAAVSPVHRTPSLPAPKILQMAAVAAWRGSPSPPPSKGEVHSEPPGERETHVHTYACAHTCLHTHTHSKKKSPQVLGPDSIALSLTSGLDPRKLSNQEK